MCQCAGCFPAMLIVPNFEQEAVISYSNNAQEYTELIPY